jgi:hypothetical protein
VTELLFIIPICVLSFLLYWEKRDRAAERLEHKAERISLLNRIQDPQVEVARSAPDPSDEPVYVPFEDDRAHDTYIDQRANGEVI